MTASHEPAISFTRQLVGGLRRHAAPAAFAWLEAQLALAENSPLGDTFLIAFASAGRRLGTAPFSFGEDAPALPAHLAQQVAGRSRDEVGRMALLFAATPDLAQLSDLFYRGGAGEKQAILRALPLLPEPRRYLDLAVESCRSSVQTVFEAIACENVYPAEQFSELAYNQMVLKSLFNEVRAARIVGLERRAGPELLRMVQGYAEERRAAGRTVPEDIALISQWSGDKR